ncbi:MAG: UbiX family flavin prenyltransferase [Bacteroidales bacterium]
MKVIVAITGASGAVYAHRMLRRLAELGERLEEVALVVSRTAEEVWRYELPGEPLEQHAFKRHDPESFFSPVASGSAGYDAMIVVPCSVGTLGRIAAGTADDLIARAADVMLKERRKLILVLREAPYNLIHIRNMAAVTEAGAVVMPANPSFYMNPQSIEELCDTVVERAMVLAGVISGGRGFMTADSRRQTAEEDGGPQTTDRG